MADDPQKPRRPPTGNPRAFLQSLARKDAAESAEPGGPSRPRRRKQRIPSWYHPKREDPASLPSAADLDRKLREYEESHQRTQHASASSTGVVRALPRREIATPEFSMSPMLLQQQERFTASLMQTLGRFLVWILGILSFQLGILWDKLLRRDSEQRRAARLLAIMQRIGGTLIKFGQQLAMRVDYLPYAYCVELSKLFDRMPSFPLKDAIATIERATGKKLREVFARFDPEPIGSASIACVYQAVLRTGEQVAVKVRRPGIAQIFAADLRALSWIIGIVEWLAILRPGSLVNLVSELEDSFLEELDLRHEAYSQEIFRRNAQNKKLTRRSFFSAPRVFFEYTSTEVIVQDFVSGIWLWEILAAVERGDQSALARMRELNIDPRIVARRLMWIAMWGNLSSTLFHADPHPANVIVQADSRIIFVDFGACGYVSYEKRNRFQEFFRCQSLKDVSGMTKAAIAMLEPLPPIDLNQFERDVERIYFRVSATMWSKQARWWERTSATLWLNLMQITRQYKLPINSDTVKMLRASLLYDTLALRLDNGLDILKEVRRFMRDATHVTGRRMRKRLKARIWRGLQLEDYAKLDELSRLAGNAIAQVKRLIDHPPFNFNYSIDKPVYTVITIIKALSFLSAMLLGVTGVWAALLLLSGKQVLVLDVLIKVLRSRPFQGLICITLLVGLRRVMFRLGDRDVKK